MLLLKKGVPFYWDKSTHHYFDAFNKSLVLNPLLSPPYYNKDFLLYLVTVESFICMVLVQEDDNLQEHVIYYLSHTLLGPELKYSHVDKFALEAFHFIRPLRHYILLCKTTVITDINPFEYVLTRWIIGGKYNNWIVVLQDFDLDFSSFKSKKSLAFIKLMSEFSIENEDNKVIDSFPYECIFLISSSDPWYGDIIIYLQTMKFPPHFSWDKWRWIRHLAMNYIIIADTLYRWEVDSFLYHFLTHEEVDLVLNDCHSGECGSHLSRLETTQKNLCVGYF